jgi:hypothetical protein
LLLYKSISDALQRTTYFFPIKLHTKNNNYHGEKKMKSKFISLAFLLVFALSTVAFADDGETNHGNKSQNPPPPAAASTSNSSNNLLTQIIDVLASLIK